VHSNITRDKAFDRLIKFEKGKQTGRIRVINKRHQSSENKKINASIASKEDCSSFKESLLKTLTNGQQDTLSKIKQILLNKLSLLTTKVSGCEDTQALLAVEKCIFTATNTCKLDSPSDFNTPLKEVPANKNITPQRPFLSTKKNAESRQLS